jgi:anti-sigma regulatory factor (Ser/Thr protein kinase)
MVVVSAVDTWNTEIAGGAEAPFAARELLTDRLGDSTPETTMHDLHLLTTELVTNAVLHAHAGPGAMIALSVTARRDRVRVAVTDGGGESTPAVQALDPDVPGGMGLFLVDQISSRWGVDRAPSGGSRVWFELAA